MWWHPVGRTCCAARRMLRQNPSAKEALSLRLISKEDVVSVDRREVVEVIGSDVSRFQQGCREGKPSPK